MTTTTTARQPGENVPWYALSAQDVTARMGVDPDDGLDGDQAERRLGEYGPNEMPAEPPPSMLAVARAQLVNPMNIMLLMVVAASFAIEVIGEPATSNIQLHELTLTKKAGDTVDVGYWRNGHTAKTTVTLGTQP